MSLLPAEILLDIIEQLVPPTAVIGYNAIWMEIPELPTWAGTQSMLPGLVHAGKQVRGAYSDLLSLRQVSRTFNDLCIPYLYRELNIHRADIPILPKYAIHVRTVRIAMDHVTQSEDRIRGVLDILDRCINATSLGLYHASHGAYTPRPLKEAFAAELLSRLRSAKFRALGFYAAWASFDIMSLLHDVLHPPEAISSIEILDISTTLFSAETFTRHKEAFSKIRTLTIRNWLGIDLRRCLGVQFEEWGPNRRLTSLSLVHCKDLYIPEVPDLVRYLVALQHLVIITQSTRSKTRAMMERNEGWSSEAGALCNVHAPLQTLYLEQGEEWETFSLAVIPTRTLILFNVHTAKPLRALVSDKENFPHMKILRLDRLSKFIGQHYDSVGRAQVKLGDFCRERGVTLRYDAHSIQKRLN